MSAISPDHVEDLRNSEAIKAFEETLPPPVVQAGEGKPPALSKPPEPLTIQFAKVELRPGMQVGIVWRRDGGLYAYPGVFEIREIRSRGRVQLRLIPAKRP